MQEWTVAALNASHVERVSTLLERCGLPSDGVSDLAGWERLWGVIEDDTVVGCGAIERPNGPGPAGLLRSLAVAEAYRGRGVGRALLRSLLAVAPGLKCHELYLLTETAESFFAGFGFRAVPRDTAPPAIRRTREFAVLCPGSAVLMRRAFPRSGPVRGPRDDRPGLSERTVT